MKKSFDCIFLYCNGCGKKTWQLFKLTKSFESEIAVDTICPKCGLKIIKCMPIYEYRKALNEDPFGKISPIMGC